MICVHIDHQHGEIDALSLQALSAARSLDDTVVAVVANDAALPDSAVTELRAYGAAEIRVATHPGLADYAPAAAGRSLAELVTQLQPAAVLAAGSARGNEVMAHLAGKRPVPPEVPPQGAAPAMRALTGAPGPAAPAAAGALS